MPADTSLTSRRAGWREACAGLAALAVAMGVGRFAFTPVLPLMLDEQALSIAGGAWLASANYLGYLLGALSAIFVRVPPQRAIRGGLVVIALGTLAMTAPLPFALWAFLRGMAGVASAWVLISVSAWCMELVLRRGMPWLSSVVFAGVGSGIAGAGLLCMAVGNAGAAVAWSALGIVALALTWAIWNRFADAPAAGPAVPVRIGWSGPVLRLVASYGLFGFGYIIPATFLPVMARDALGGGAAFVWSWPVFGLAGVLSVLPVARLVKGFGNRRVWLAAQLVMAVGLLLPLASTSLLAVLGAALAVGGTFMVITLAALQQAREVAGRESGGLIAAMTAAFAAGQILGPLSIGDGGFTVPLAIAALALVTGAVLLARPARTEFSTQE